MNRMLNEQKQKMENEEMDKNNVQALLRSMHAHCMKYHARNMNHENPEKLQTCMNILRKLRKVLPQLMGRLIQLPIQEQILKIGNLCELFNLLFQGTACPHSKTIFIDTISSNTPTQSQEINTLQSNHTRQLISPPSGQMVLKFIFHFMVFYGNADLSEVHGAICSVFIQFTRVLRSQDKYAYLHFIRDTVIALEDIIAIEQWMNTKSGTKEITASLTCFVDTAIHVYQNAQGVLGPTIKHDQRICGCETLTSELNHLQESRRDELRKLLPQCQINSLRSARLLRSTFTNLVSDLITDSNSTIVFDISFQRVQYLSLVMLEVDCKNSGKLNDVSAMSTLMLLHTVIESLSAMAISTQCYRLITSYWKIITVEYVIKNSDNDDLLQYHAKLLDTFCRIFQNLDFCLLEDLWSCIQDWMLRFFQLTNGTSEKKVRKLQAVVLEPIVKILQFFFDRNPSCCYFVVTVFLRSVKIVLIPRHILPSIINLTHRILVSKEVAQFTIHKIASKMIDTQQELNTQDSSMSGSIHTLASNNFLPPEVSRSRKRKRTLSSHEVISSHNISNLRHFDEKVSTAEFQESFGQWLTDLTCNDVSDPYENLNSLNILLRILLPFCDLLSKHSPSNTTKVLSVLHKRIEYFINEYKMIARPDFLDNYVEFYYILTVYLENAEFLRYNQSIQQFLEDLVTHISNVNSGQLMIKHIDHHYTDISTSLFRWRPQGLKLPIWDDTKSTSFASASVILDFVNSKGALLLVQLLDTSHKVDLSCARVINYIILSCIVQFRAQIALADYRHSTLAKIRLIDRATQVLNETDELYLYHIYAKYLPLLATLENKLIRNGNGDFPTEMANYDEISGEELPTLLIDLMGIYTKILKGKLSKKSPSSEIELSYHLSLLKSCSSMLKAFQLPLPTPHRPKSTLLMERDLNSLSELISAVTNVSSGTLNQTTHSTTYVATQLDIISSTLHLLTCECNEACELILRCLDIILAVFEITGSSKVIQKAAVVFLSATLKIEFVQQVVVCFAQGQLWLQGRIHNLLGTSDALMSSTNTNAPRVGPDNFYNQFENVVKLLGTLGGSCLKQSIDNESVSQPSEIRNSVLEGLTTIWSSCKTTISQNNNVKNEAMANLCIVAFDEIRCMTNAEYSWTTMFREFPNKIYYPLLKHLLLHDTISSFFNTFVQCETGFCATNFDDLSDFLWASAAYIMPSFVINGENFLMEAFELQYNNSLTNRNNHLKPQKCTQPPASMSLQDILLAVIDFILKELLIHQLVVDDRHKRVEQWNFLFRFMEPDTTIRDILSYSPVRLLSQLVFELGGPRCDTAKRVLREVTKYLYEKQDQNQQDSGTHTIQEHLMPMQDFVLPQYHFLALISHLGDKFTHDNVLVKRQAILSLSQLLTMFSTNSDDNIENKPTIECGMLDPFVPKVMAILKRALADEQIREQAMITLHTFVHLLSPKAMMSNFISIIVSFCPFLDTLECKGGSRTKDMQDNQVATKDTAILLLEYLFINQRDTLKSVFPRIRILPSIPSIDHIHAIILEELGSHPADQSLHSYFQHVLPYIKHWDVAVRKQALVDLSHTLTMRSHDLKYLLSYSDSNLSVYPIVSKLVQVILQLARMEIQHDSTIKLLCAKCLGGFGAIDATRMPLHEFYNSGAISPIVSQGKMSENSVDKYEKVDGRELSTRILAAVIIENWLVNELRAAPETTDAVGYTIQELLKFLAGLQGKKGDNGIPIWLQTRWDRKDKDILQHIEPYWFSNYIIKYHETNNTNLDGITFYEKYSSSYDTWLVAWCQRLIHLSQPPERQIFLSCHMILTCCPQIASFLLPYLIQNILRLRDVSIYDEVKYEILAVLYDRDMFDDFRASKSTSGRADKNYREMSAATRGSQYHQCCQTIFSTLDELGEWVWNAEIKKVKGRSSGSIRQSGYYTDQFEDNEKENVDEFLKDIPSQILSKAAYNIRAFTRAIRYFEVFLRQENYSVFGRQMRKPVAVSSFQQLSSSSPLHFSIIAKHATYLQQLYSSVDEPDALTGLATFRRLNKGISHIEGAFSVSLTQAGGDDNKSTSITTNLRGLIHQIIDHEQLAQWEDALSCYEQALQVLQSSISGHSTPNDIVDNDLFPDIAIDDTESLANCQQYSQTLMGLKRILYVGTIRCLIQLGRFESALQQINGVSAQDTESVKNLYPYALDCAWRLSRWDLVDDLLRSETTSATSLPQELASTESSTLLRGLGIQVQSHDLNISDTLLVRVLHSLHKRDASAFERNLKAAQLEAMGPLTAAAAESYQRVYPLLHKLHCLHEIERGFIAIEEMDKLPVAKKKDTWQTLCPWDDRYDTLAPTLKFRGPVLDLRRALLNEAHLITEVAENYLTFAKLSRKEGYLRTAASAIMHAETLKHPFAAFEKAKLIACQGRVYEALKLLEPVDIDPTKIDFGNAENPRHAAKLLLLATNWMKDTGQRHGKEVIARYKAVIHYDTSWDKGYFYLAHYYDYLHTMEPNNGNYLLKLLQYYAATLARGTKFLFQSLPRFLTVWFESSETHPKDSSSSKSLHMHKVNKIIDDAIASLPAYEWFLCFPQVTSRICHPNQSVVNRVQKIIMKVLVAYPLQAMWPLVGLCWSLNRDRRQKTLDVIELAKLHFHSCQESTTAMMINDSIILSEELIKIAGTDPGSEKSMKIVIRRFRSKILVPIQSTLGITLPRGGVAPPDEDYDPYGLTSPITIQSFKEYGSVMNSKEKPKRLEIVGSNGQVYPFLCKREKTGDLRKDARMMEFNTMINRLLQKDSEGRRRKLRLRTYAVICLNEESGLMEWVCHTKAMRQLIIQIHRTECGIMPPFRITREIKDKYLKMQETYQNNPTELAKVYYDQVLRLPAFTPRFHQWFLNHFADPTAWFESRLMFTRSTAVWSMVGHIIGLGDRHGENILIDCQSGECVHVDFDCLFDKGLKLPKPEIVPFRLTPNIIDACGITGYEGVFRRVCEVTMSLLRENKGTLISVLEAFIHDPLVEWTRQGKTSQANNMASTQIAITERGKQETRLILSTIDARLMGIYNLGQGVRPLSTSQHQKLLPEIETLPLSVEGQVDKLIQEAVKYENLAQMYIGWMPFL